jgi:hypothetical protein
MKERPILFSGAMVRAILEGRKAQTRRVVSPQPEHPHFASRPMLATDDEGVELYLHSAALARAIRCPYGRPGDRLWVRETFKQVASGQLEETGAGEAFGLVRYGVAYQADNATVWNERPTRVTHVGGTPTGPMHLADQPKLWKSSIHMPRRFSRITLEITGVRAERLQDISGKDAEAEGVKCETADPLFFHVPTDRTVDDVAADYRRNSYRKLWDRLNAARGYGWDVKPWVWCVSFQRIEACNT